MRGVRAGSENEAPRDRKRGEIKIPGAVADAGKRFVERAVAGCYSTLMSVA